MFYKKALKYLDSFINYEKRPDFSYNRRFLNLQRMGSLLDLLGNPQRDLKFIHITGTKGKGSTAAMIASILRAAGLKVGLYTSPHLISPRERIRIGDHLISRREFAHFLSQIKPKIEKLKGNPSLSPTFFEIYTALALVYFFHQEVDLAILEVGIGGRLDATNVIHPLVAVITQISRDHTKELGNDPILIAREKAEIIKEGSRAITSPQEERVLSIIKEVCKKKRVGLYEVDKDIKFKGLKFNSQGHTFRVQGIRQNYPHLFLPLLGKHQLINAATAIGAVELLGDYGISISPEGVRQGLRKVKWPGRIEILSQKPLFLVDCAHNEASAQELAKCLRELFSGKRIILILGILKNKDGKGIGRALCPLGDEIILTRINSPRALEPEKLSEEIREFCPQMRIEKDLSSAIGRARSLARSQDLICITGSVYLAGEVFNKLKRRKLCLKG